MGKGWQGYIFFLFRFHFELKFLKTNHGDLDQLLQSVASDLGLHCMFMSVK